MEGVLTAALEEFAQHGWDGLHIDQVAQRADVNKTTIYRRWPSKLELLRAALLARAELAPEPPDTGALRSDLVVLLTLRMQHIQTPMGMGVARAILLGGSSPSLMSIRETVRERKPLVPDVVIDRAIARGELPAGIDRALFRELLVGPLQARIFLRNERVDAPFVERVVDVVCSGIRDRASPHESPLESGPVLRAAPASRSRRGRR